MSVIGSRLNKIDALDKVLGRTRYTDDICLPQMAFGKIVRSPHAHAKIVRIDASSVEQIPGVLAVITGADLPRKYGVIPWTKDEYPLALDKARFVGDGVAAVIATSESAAFLGASKLKIEYEILPAILNIAEAKSRTDVKVNEHAKVGNITKEVNLQFGDVDRELARSHLVLRESFQFHNTTHAPIEPHCAIGDYAPSGLLTVYSSTQVPHYLHRTLAEVLAMDESLIRVIQPAVGGAFGGKSEPFDLEFVVAIAAIRLRRPVKILYTREEVFFAHRGRHPMNMDMTLGLDQTGRITAVRNIIDIDGGAYASFGMITAFYAGQLLTGPTQMGSYHFHATRYYTNKPPCGPKRGHGSVQPRFALEILLDMAAEKLGIDPIKLRQQNALRENSETINGQMVGSLGLKETLDTVAVASNFYERHKKLPYGRGLGVASSMYISGTNYPVYPNEMPQSSVVVRLDRSGAVHIFSGAADIGQGSNSVLAHIAMAELGAKPATIRVISGDTDLTPVDLGSYSSRVTLMMGTAAREACVKAQRVLASHVADYFNHEPHWQPLIHEPVTPSQIAFEEGRVFLKTNLEVAMDFKSAVILAESKHGSLAFTGDYRTEKRGGDYRGGSIGASPAYSCTSHVADVSVDVTTGKITINRIFAAHDCGRAINQTSVEGQIEGSTYMGAAEVFLEHLVTDEEAGARRGLMVATNLLDYRIPTTLDTPDITALIVEHPDKNGPYGAKEAGEGPLHSAIPAIANAVYDAVGIRLFSLPFSPAKVLQALQNKATQL
jgi:4-hydroxybenzoyl-CoA reductase subunit alpha